MGLSVVHGIVKSHSGDISVESEPGKGTAFHILLPCLKSVPEEIDAVSHKTAPTEQGRILFVDDEIQIIDFSTKMLEKLGYDVVPRTDSVEALEAFRANPMGFDAVITDMTMPNMTGMHFSREILKIRPDIPIIVCTGFSEKISPEIARKAGVRELLMKPVSLDDLAKTLQNILNPEEERDGTYQGRILIVDDDEPFRELIRQMLEPEGYEVVQAEDGKQAMRVQEETPADLVVMDIFMPEMDGIAAIVEFRKKYPDVKIISISGGGKQVAGDCLSQTKLLGAVRSFEKPINREELIAEIRELLLLK